MWELMMDRERREMKDGMDESDGKRARRGEWSLTLQSSTFLFHYCG